MKVGILFDLDGTLLDTLQDLTSSVNYALGQYGLPARTCEQVRQAIGSGARLLIARSLPDNSSESFIDEVLATYQAHYKLNSQVATAPYPGVLDALEELKKQFPIGIVSNKPDAPTKALCADFFPGIYARGESTDCVRKPAPDMLLKTMELIGVDRCIYVGDSDVDVITAQNTGAPCLSVLWGFRNEADIRQAGGKYFCHDPKDLAQTLKNMVKEIYGQ